MTEVKGGGAAGAAPESPARLGMAGWVFLLSLVAAAALAAAGPLYQLDFLALRGAFTFLTVVPLIAIGLLCIGFVAAALARIEGNGKAVVVALLSIAINVTVIAIPLSQRAKARSVPPIHDITTDMENPPVFVDVLPVRQGAPNPAEYGGAEIAAQQSAAYPDIAPLYLDEPRDKAFELALAAARKLRWDLISENRVEGRIEATDTTFWFGFKDDVVIRLTETETGGTRIDVRSVSRVGMSDIGANARRVRAFLSEVSP